MITVEAVKELAKQLLMEKQVPFGDCIHAYEFPDGTVTLHFARTDTIFYRDGCRIEVRSSPGTIVVMADRNKSIARMPDGYYPQSHSVAFPATDPSSPP